MPLASVPTQISGRNRVWRRVAIDAIRTIRNGRAASTPSSRRDSRTAARCCGSSAAIPSSVSGRSPTLAQADKGFDDYVANYVRPAMRTTALRARVIARLRSRSSLERITAPLLAINSADDLVNPPELGVLEREIMRVAARSRHRDSRSAIKPSVTGRTRWRRSGSLTWKSCSA